MHTVAVFQFTGQRSVQVRPLQLFRPLDLHPKSLSIVGKNICVPFLPFSPIREWMPMVKDTNFCVCTVGSQLEKKLLISQNWDKSGRLTCLT
jgi:hypothetical protein